MPGIDYNAPPIGTDNPQDFQNYYAAQNRQLIAQMLMGQMQQSAQTPPQWDAMRLVPRRSALSNLTTVLSGALAGRGLQQAQQAQAKYFQGLNAPPGGGQPTASAQPQGAAAFPADYQPGGGPALPPASGATAPNAPAGAMPAGAPSAQPQGGAGDLQEFLREARANDPSLNLAAKYNTDKWQEFSANAALKFGVASGGERPGMPIRLGNRTIGFAPDPEKGIYYTIGTNGEPVPHEMQGQRKMEAAKAGEIAGAQEAAKAPYEDIPIPQKIGPSRVISRAQFAAEQGGAQPQQGAQSPQTPDYFKPRSQPSQPNSAPQSPAVPRGQAGYDPTDARNMGYLTNAPSSAISTNDKGAELNYVHYQERRDKQQDMIGPAAASAQRKDFYLMKGLEHLPSAPEGKGAEGLMDTASYALSLGVLPKNLEDKVASGNIVEKDFYNAALGGFQEMFGTNKTGQQEVMLALNKMFPNISQAKQATIQLVYQNRVVNGYAQIEEQARQAAIKAGKDTGNFKNDFEAHYSLSDYEQQNRQRILDEMDGALKKGGGSMPGATPNKVRIQDVPAGNRFNTEADAQAARAAGKIKHGDKVAIGNSAGYWSDKK